MRGMFIPIWLIVVLLIGLTFNEFRWPALAIFVGWFAFPYVELLFLKAWWKFPFPNY